MMGPNNPLSKKLRHSREAELHNNFVCYAECLFSPDSRLRGNDGLMDYQR